MEIRYRNKNVCIIDDCGSTPIKAKSSLKSLKEDFPESTTIVVFEPSSGSRNIKSVESYENSFQNADIILLPRFSKLGLDTKSERFDEKDLEKILTKFNFSARFIEDDEILVNQIIKIIKSNVNTTVLFMGSHSFRKIIQNLINILKNGKN